MKKITLLLFLFLICLSSNAQDFIKPLQGASMYGRVTQVNDTAVIFFNEMNQGKYLPLSNLEFIEYRKNGIQYFHPQRQRWLQEENLVGIPIEEKKNVYIPIHHTDIEEYHMARRLRELIAEDGYWNLVDTPQEANFNLRAFFSYDRQPLAWFVITTHDGHTLYKSEVVASGGNTPEQAGVIGAYNLFTKALPYVKKKPYSIWYRFLKRKK